MSSHVSSFPFVDLSGRVAVVTGANHDIGAATASCLAACGAAVLITYLRIEDATDPGIPDTYRRNRGRDAEHVVQAIADGGGNAVTVEADLAAVGVPEMLFDAAEKTFGPVDILVNNATGWVADTFTADTTDRLGRDLRRVSAATSTNSSRSTLEPRRC